MTLSGRRVLVTRAEEQGEELAALVRRAGGVPVLFPTIRTASPEDSGPLDREIGRLSSFDWVLFSSPNAAHRFHDRRVRLGLVSWPSSLRVGSVGPGTTRALASLGFPVHLTAARHTGEGLAEALKGAGIAGRRFLVPGAAEGRDALREALRKEGGQVVAVAAYRTVTAEKDEEAAAKIVSAPPDVCTFASPSAFRGLFLLLGEDDAGAVLRKSRIAVIGEVTARAVAERDFRVDIVPETYTLKAMVDAIEAYFAQGR